MRSPSTRPLNRRLRLPGDVAARKRVARVARALDLDLLVVLLDAQLRARRRARRRAPRPARSTGRAGSRRPGPGGAASRRMVSAAVGLPAGHAEGVRHDARAGRELVEEARLQLVDQRRQQVDGHHARLRDVGGQHVALHEATRGPRRSARRAFSRDFSTRRGVELDAQAARAELLRRRDHDAAVARAEVDHQVVGARAGELAACARPPRRGVVMNGGAPLAFLGAAPARGEARAAQARSAAFTASASRSPRAPRAATSRARRSSCSASRRRGRR